MLLISSRSNRTTLVLLGALARLARLDALLHPLRLAATGVLGLATGVLQSEDTTLDRVDENVAGLEVRVVAPGAEELDGL